MFSVAYAKELYGYYYWANARILAKAALLSPEQRDQVVIAGHSSIHATLVHMLGVEVIWGSRWNGVSPRARLQLSDLPTFELLQARWQESEQLFRAKLAELDPADIQNDLAFTDIAGKQVATPLWQILTQIVNHGMQHRSEIAAMLTILGQSPGDLDIIYYFRDPNF